MQASKPAACCTDARVPSRQSNYVLQVDTLETATRTPSAISKILISISRPSTGLTSGHDVLVHDVPAVRNSRRSILLEERRSSSVVSCSF